MRHLLLLFLFASPVMAKPCGPVILQLLKDKEAVVDVNVYHVDGIGHFFTSYIIERGSLVVVKVPSARYGLFQSILTGTGLVLKSRKTCKESNVNYILVRIQSEVRA